MAIAAQLRSGGGYEAGVVGTVGRVAGITLPEGHGFVSVLGAKLLDQVLVTCITEVGRLVTQLGQLADFETTDVDFDHSPGNKLGAKPAVGVVTSGAIPRGRMYILAGQVQTVVIMAGPTEVFLA